MKKFELKGATVVLTGATSGLGKAIALAFAAKGANLVLAARRELILKEVAAECQSLGANAIAVPTDVTASKDMENLFEKAQSFSGKIDVWINNAGVGSVGEFNEVPLEVHEQVIRTNLLGYLYGAYVVLPHFKLNDRGTIINMLSVGAYVPSPNAVAYSASKFGARGFAEALKFELTEYDNIAVCDVFPGFLDTPGLKHAANFTGKKLRPAAPLLDPFVVAEKIVELAENPKGDLTIGSQAFLARAAYALSPKMVGKTMQKFMHEYFDHAKDVAITAGNIFEPVPQGTSAHGGWTKPAPGESWRNVIRRWLPSPK